MQAVADTDHARMIPVDAVAGAQAKLHGFLVRAEHAGDHGGADHCAGDAVGIHGVSVDTVKDPARDGAGQADAKAVSV
ncbi:hypothetical protein SDC9_188937 [bioreactor metagenome]|uniref:Uncharacterized protein n=1 Tax=bioreactor metagenome TaxID=1076179 RepID=A0A645HQQ5_9ZZZZ